MKFASIVLLIVVYQASHSQPSAGPGQDTHNASAQTNESVPVDDKHGANAGAADINKETHDNPDLHPFWPDGVNALSTAVIAFFTVWLFVGVVIQIRTSRSIERAWLMVELAKEKEGTTLIIDSSRGYTAFVKICLRNAGNHPAWVVDVRAKTVPIVSNKVLPLPDSLTEQDSLKWYPAPIGRGEDTEFVWSAYGGEQRHGFNVAIIGKIIYRDIFNRQRISTFGYYISNGSKLGLPDLLIRAADSREHNKNT